MSSNPPFSHFQPVPFDPFGVNFIEDEGNVSYGDSSGTEISVLPWHEAVKVFAVCWRKKQAYRLAHPDPEYRRLAGEATGARERIGGNNDLHRLRQTWPGSARNNCDL